MTPRHRNRTSIDTAPAETECVENALRVCRAAALPAFVLTGPSHAATLFANDALCALLGKEPAAGGQPAPAWFGPVWPAVLGAVDPLFSGDTGEPVGIELLPVGDADPAAFEGVPLTQDGQTVAVLALATQAAPDDRVVARMEREMRAEIERTTAARSRFLASASHDLRQPFQAMRLFLDALCSQISDEKALSTAEMLGNAMTAGERLLNALLDISTLDAGTVTPDPQTVSLDELLGQLVEEFRPQSEEKGLRLRARLCPGTVKTDPVLFGRVMRNLLTNAIRYTRHGGLLLAMRRRGNRWRIDVWDTGFGIPEEQLTAIFDEFHQLQNPNRDPTRGLGLGLAIVRRLAELLGLQVEVRSRIGRGTVFSISLEAASPLAEPPCSHVSPPPSTASAPPLTGMTVLAVDDEAMVLTGLQMILESWGCTVAAAGDMREVFAVLDGLPDAPSVILTDLRLPGKVSGFDVIDRVRRLYGQEIPAVVLSGETAQSALLEGQRRGCSFLHKPLHPGDLRQVLERLRGGEDKGEDKGEGE
ncbi:hybrid sensor histidine kinase/response regulator (plasmid) [Azospirillum baldaniorum]|uniref:histidine kinase n=1 Tax=Azospirillum baldaniorum TaxID=1064539 RepID=A0A9P1NP16_9PROT|nr:hybrid sensor histidine kinase/response regulator [Azospirillum brasilense]AWJ92025.1 hybrid sensor histidine kinase/response regulator [Azospirillum baldaniorum]UKJ74983.1 hybrid sensor histidine kinase/response regulator [Azospirillum brasilense]CCD00474.1 two-component hybrid sensor and regulator [Azospirillum baldaniorum]